MESQRRVRFVDLFDSEAYYPILDVLSSYLTFADSVVLCQVCKRLGGLKKHMLKKIANVNTRLGDFLDDPISFRSQLGKYDALIAGIFALNILELGSRKVSYLDVFVGNGVGADEFTQYLEEKEGYQMENPEMEMTRTCRVYERTRQPSIKLRITRTSGPPVQTILESSYTTAYVNFITWNKVYSIFPRQTLIDHRCHPLRLLDSDSASTWNELSHQEWTARDIIWPDFDRAPKIDGLRRIGDSSTLVVPLDQDSVQSPQTPDFIIDYAQFTVVSCSKPQPLRLIRSTTENTPPYYCFLQIKASTLTSHAVRYRYTTGDGGWSRYIEEILSRWAWFEFYKLQSRPSLRNDVFPLISDLRVFGNFEKPATWDYADDQIPRWYQEWEQTKRSGY